MADARRVRRLDIDERPARPGPGAGSGPTVVFVHGSLDRGASFDRVRRRLPELTTVVYDRRGYQGSRAVLPAAGSLADHVADLLEVVGGREVVVCGHSYGGNVALGAALDPAGTTIRAAAAYEPPQPWLGRSGPGGDGAPPPRRAPAHDQDPAAAAEAFFRRMVGDAAWDRLPEDEKAGRRADGPALAAELAAIRLSEPPFDIRALRVPAVYGRGGNSLPHHRRAVAWLVERTPGAELFEIAGARHGAHLSHPGAFAAMVRRAVARAAESSALRP